MQERSKKKQVANGPISSNEENSCTNEVACLRREIVGRKALIERLKEEAEKKYRTHKTAIATIQNKDRIIEEYRSKTERYSRAIEVM